MKLTRSAIGLFATLGFAMVAAGCGGSSSSGTDPVDNGPDTGRGLIYSLNIASSSGLPIAIPGGTSSVPPGLLRNELLLCQIYGGSLVLGTNANEATHQSDEGLTTVFVQPFNISMCEITNGQWSVIDPTWTAWSSLGLSSTAPAVGISASVARARLATFNATRPVGGRLRFATETEWEFACRGGQTSQYSWGGNFGADTTPHSIAEFAVVRETSGLASGVRSVGKSVISGGFIFNRRPNAYGVFDMHGNAWEWVDVPGVSQPGIMRGGSYVDSLVSARAANRQYMDESIPYATVGLRFVNY